MKPPVNPISEEDRATFHVHLLAWAERLGLQDWRVHFSSKNAAKGIAANVQCYYRDGLARIRLGKDFGDDRVTDESLEATALHELLHVLLYELVNQNECGLEGDALAAAEHRVVHLLEKLLLRGQR